MNFSELVLKRQSVRKYIDKKVEQDKIDKIIEACRNAPSASNSQPWHIIMVTDQNIKNKVAKSTYSNAVSFNKFAIQANAIAVIVIEKPYNRKKIWFFYENIT